MGRRWIIALLCLSFVLLLGPGTVAWADDDDDDDNNGKNNGKNVADFSFFDNTNPATPSQGIQCTARKAFEYHISVSDFGNSANVLRITYADGDFVHFNTAAGGTQQLSGFARGGTVSQGFPDRCISICAETPGKLAGQMSVKTDSSSQPAIKCNNVTCEAGGVAPACP